MTSKVSILHISDLHKSDDERYDNLLQSLLDDSDRYSNTEGILKPNVIVVSGDLINGGKPNEITKQYNEVGIFLNKLVDNFLGGDKSRIIIVPGNHDVDWNASKDAMRELPDLSNDKSKLESAVKEYFEKEESDYRWSWESLMFNIVDNKKKYQKRFANFAKFYKAFYDGKREFSLDPSKQYDVFDIPALNVTFFCFNSAYATDHLRDTGKIYPDCLTLISDKIKDYERQGRLLIAVWHHNTSGRPIQSDYMDSRILQKMISYNIHIGLYGHQHSCEIVDEINNPIDRKRMLLISAGSLYGKPDVLPPGTTRQYNIIELVPDTGCVKVFVHSRENIDKDLYSCPEWHQGRIDRIGVDKWEGCLKINNTMESDLNGIITMAERTKDYLSAIEKLKTLDTGNSGVRKVLLHFMTQIKDYQGVIDLVKEPRTTIEAMALMEAALEVGTPESLEIVRHCSYIAGSSDPSIVKMFSYFNRH